MQQMNTLPDQNQSTILEKRKCRASCPGQVMTRRGGVLTREMALHGNPQACETVKTFVSRLDIKDKFLNIVCAPKFYHDLSHCLLVSLKQLPEVFLPRSTTLNPLQAVPLRDSGRLVPVILHTSAKEAYTLLAHFSTTKGRKVRTPMTLGSRV